MIEKIQLYNKGKREWTIGEVRIASGRTADIEKSVAEQYTRRYPQDFVLGGPAQSGTSARKMKLKITALEKENAGLKAELEKIKAKKTKPATTKKTEEK